MKKMPLFLIILSCAVLPVLSACSGAAATAAPSGNSSANPLAGTNWKLASYGPASAPQPALPDVDTNLNFGADGAISGRLGCNSMGGDYTATGQNITFGSIYATEMACDEPRMAQEGAAFPILNGTVGFTIAGDTLTITSTDGSSILTFTKIANP